VTTLTNSQARRLLAAAPSRVLDAETCEAQAQIQHEGRWLRLGFSERSERTLRVVNFSTDGEFYRDPVGYHLRTMRHGARLADGHLYVLES
jgi:hypothetical protein